MSAQRASQPAEAPPWLATVLLAHDDAEESVMGTHLHQKAIIMAYGALRDHAAALGTPEAPAWYVSTQETVIVQLPLRSRVWQSKPDVWVVPEFSVHEDTSYDTRKHGPMPSFILEVASDSTWQADVDEKSVLYDRAGVKEYLIFDPTGEFLPEFMRGWRRAPSGDWEAWEGVTRAGGVTVWESRVLGLALRAEGPLLRFEHPQRGLLPLWSEAQALRQAQERELAERNRALAERDRALAEERRQRAELEAELRRLRGKASNAGPA